MQMIHTSKMQDFNILSYKKKLQTREIILRKFKMRIKLYKKKRAKFSERDERNF